MLQEEKQKTDEYERKYVEAQGSSEELRKKLTETEKRVYQLQDSLNSVYQDDIFHVKSSCRAEDNLEYFIKIEFNFSTYC